MTLLEAIVIKIADQAKRVPGGNGVNWNLHAEADLILDAEARRMGCGVATREPMFVGAPGCCMHNVSLERTCDKCAESYGNARPTSL